MTVDNDSIFDYIFIILIDEKYFKIYLTQLNGTILLKFSYIVAFHSFIY